jgi:hypothetical protein
MSWAQILDRLQAKVLSKVALHGHASWNVQFKCNHFEPVPLLEPRIGNSNLNTRLLRPQSSLVGLHPNHCLGEGLDALLKCKFHSLRQLSMIMSLGYPKRPTLNWCEYNGSSKSFALRRTLSRLKKHLANRCPICRSLSLPGFEVESHASLSGPDWPESHTFSFATKEKEIRQGKETYEQHLLKE